MCLEIQRDQSEENNLVSLRVSSKRLQSRSSKRQWTDFHRLGEYASGPSGKEGFTFNDILYNCSDILPLRQSVWGAGGELNFGGRKSITTHFGDLNVYRVSNILHCTEPSIASEMDLISEKECDDMEGRDKFYKEAKKTKAKMCYT